MSPLVAAAARRPPIRRRLRRPRLDDAQVDEPEDRIQTQQAVADGRCQVADTQELRPLYQSRPPVRSWMSYGAIYTARADATTTVASRRVASLLAGDVNWLLHSNTGDSPPQFHRNSVLPRPMKYRRRCTVK